jgi:hypothetical protein
MTLTASTPRLVLVLADAAVNEERLQDAVAAGAAADARVLVVAPALNSRLRHWVSDTDAASRAAEERLLRCLERLRLAGVDANGMVGDADPVQAIGDALRLFPADEIVIATASAVAAGRPRRELVERASVRFAQPVRRVVAGP